MSQKSDKKLWTAVVIGLFLGLCCLALVAVILWNQNQNKGSSEGDNTPSSQSEAKKQMEDQNQANKDLYEHCLSNSDKLYSQYASNPPKGLTVDQTLAYQQGLSQTRDSQKLDCDRKFGPKD